ncbi:MAG TPA: beta-N-acetylglucosaminidase domain-containing protein [Streptosporangiales bacterium]
MNSLSRKGLSGLAVAAVLAGTVTVPAAAAAAPGTALPQISPQPQSERLLSGQVALPPTVQLVEGAHADDAAVGLVKSVLHDHGIETTQGSAPVTVAVGTGGDDEVKQGLAQLHQNGTAGLPAEGYVFAAGRDDADHGRVVLGGVDGVGTYYAAQTLRQALTGRTVPAMVVRDWPGFAMRGGMESFYGPTWSWDDRYDQVDFLATHKMNYFFYGPAGDARTGTQWGDLYPSDELAKFADLVKYAAARHVKFIYRVSPEAPLDASKGICHSSKADRDKLIARFQQLYDIGVRRFVIAWDDVSGHFACAADQTAYGDDPQPIAAAQAAVLNDMQARFFDSHPDVEPTITVPTQYYGIDSTPYRTRFDDLVTQKMQIYWTGPAVVSPQITVDDEKSTQAAFPKHRLVVWDNYPVNDYDPNRLFLGPLVGRDPGLGKDTLGITFNEMVEQAPSQIPLWTEADYAWNPAGYDAKRSWDAAIRGLGGDAADALRVFAENNRSNGPVGGDLAQESPTLTPLVHDLTSAYTSGGAVDGPAKELDDYLARMRSAPDEMRSGLPDPLFATEAKPWLDDMTHAAGAGDDAAAALTAQASGDGAGIWKARLGLDAERRALAANPQVVASGVLDPLYGLARSESDAWLGVPWYGDTGTPTGNPPAAQGSSLAAAADDKLDTAYRAAQAPTEGDSLELPLTRTHPLRDVVVLRPEGDTATGTVQAKHDGTWVDLGPLQGAYTLVPGGDRTADAVRIVWDAGTTAPGVDEIVPRYSDVFTGRLGTPGRQLVASGHTTELDVDVTAIAQRSVAGTLAVGAPDGWQVSPASQPLDLTSDGRTVRHTYPIEVSVPSGASGEHTLTVTLTAPGAAPLTAQIPVKVGTVADVAYPELVGQQNPSGYWRLGESSGTALTDSSGHGQDGSYRPTVTLGVPGALAGDTDTAARLDGGYGEVPSSASVSPTGAYTVEAWVRPSAIRPDPGTAIVEKYSTPANNGFAFRLDGAGHLQAWNLGAGSYALVTGTTSVSTGRWHHVAAVFDGSNLTVYLDGWPDASVETSVAPAAGPASLKIGARGDDAGQRWQGDMDEVALYPSALSADQIATHYLTGTTR